MGAGHSYNFFVMPSDDGQGPKKLGNPDDISLSEVENKVLIPLLHNHIILSSKCKYELEDFTKCTASSGLLSSFKCDILKRKLNSCIGNWDKSSELDQETMFMYLRMRSEYRKTGVDPQLPFMKSDKSSVEI